MTDLIDPLELVIERWPPNELGGQHVGSGPRGIKITHLPTGMVAIMTSSRSQHQNQQVAMAMIEGGLTCPKFRW